MGPEARCRSSQVQQNNVSNGGSGGIPYSTNLLTYWRDVYVILFDPLPINFHGLGEMIAALENTIILGLIVASWRQLQIVPRASFARAYVMMCAIYSFGFIYAFAALGNLGLITRERTLLFPFLLVLLCIPRAKRGQPPRYIWELKRSHASGTNGRVSSPSSPRPCHLLGGRRCGLRRTAAVSGQRRPLPGLPPSRGSSRVSQIAPTTSRLKCSSQ